MRLRGKILMGIILCLLLLACGVIVTLYRPVSLVSYAGIENSRAEIVEVIVEDFTREGMRAELRDKAGIDEFCSVMEKVRGRIKSYDRDSQSQGSVYVILITYADGTKTMMEAREAWGRIALADSHKSPLWIEESDAVFGDLESLIESANVE